MKSTVLFIIFSIAMQFAHAQTQIGSSDIWYSGNNTVIGNSGGLLEPYSGYNSQNNKSFQLFGNTSNYGIPNLILVKNSDNHKYGGSLIWLSNNFNTSDKRFAQISGNVINGSGNITFNTRSESDTQGYFNSMVLDGEGNVGIGTNNPESKLSVNGLIRATEVKVLADISVPDYVFEPGYGLRTLQETKAYITENKHLPEIPSASEMEVNGIDLGDMNMRLLKKIEELTLYQIELMEEMEMMKKELKELKGAE